MSCYHLSLIILQFVRFESIESQTLTQFALMRRITLTFICLFSANVVVPIKTVSSHKLNYGLSRHTTHFISPEYFCKMLLCKVKGQGQSVITILSFFLRMSRIANYLFSWPQAWYKRK